MKMTIVYALLLTGGSTLAQSQAKEQNPKLEASVNGQFLVSTDFHSVFLNFIGTGIKYTKGNKSVSISVFPAIRFHQDNNPDPTQGKRPFVTAGFALGPLVQYKRIFVGFPAFYDGHELKWRYTVGIGLRIGS